jgi:S-adenosylmethionine hydrolase
LAPSGKVTGELLFHDRFGNWTTSIGLLTAEADEVRLRPWIPGLPATLLPRHGLKVFLPDRKPLGLFRTFSEVPAGVPLAFVGSDGLLEIGVNQGNATEALSLHKGLPVEIGE